jgi:hypothetical protein
VTDVQRGFLDTTGRSHHNRIRFGTVFRLRAGSSRFRIPAGERDFSLLQSIQTDSGTHPASCSMGNRALSPGVKRPGREANHSLPSSAEVKTECGHIFIPHICFHGLYRSNFTFYLLLAFWKQRLYIQGEEFRLPTPHLWNAVACKGCVSGQLKEVSLPEVVLCRILLILPARWYPLLTFIWK